jgi:dipeptidyl aminopeptidase/acylaminoacyl peptidase
MPRPRRGVLPPVLRRGAAAHLRYFLRRAGGSPSLAEVSRRTRSWPPCGSCRPDDTLGRRALVALALLLVLASAATATYVVVTDGGGNAPSLLDSPSNGPASLSGIDADGQVQVIWRCPHGTFCGEVTSVAWAPDGWHVALALTEVGLHSPYPGLHVIDTVSGRDTKLFGLSPLLVAPAGSVAHRRAADRAYARAIATFGCLTPDELAWSPDGSQIAYVCAFGLHGRLVSQIHVVNADGTHPRLLRTGTNAAWPSWSPTGSRIAFSTASKPLTKGAGGHWDRATRSIVYTVDRAGARARPHAARASARPAGRRGGPAGAGSPSARRRTSTSSMPAAAISSG